MSLLLFYRFQIARIIMVFKPCFDGLQLACQLQSIEAITYYIGIHKAIAVVVMAFDIGFIYFNVIWCYHLSIFWSINPVTISFRKTDKITYFCTWCKSRFPFLLWHLYKGLESEQKKPADIRTLTENYLISGHFRIIGKSSRYAITNEIGCINSLSPELIVGRYVSCFQ